METWTLKVGDDGLYLKCEDGRKHGKYAAAVMIGEQNGRNVPINLSKIFNLFFTVSSNVKSLENILIKKLDMD